MRHEYEYAGLGKPLVASFNAEFWFEGTDFISLWGKLIDEP